jgi:hypothetical protein
VDEGNNNVINTSTLIGQGAISSRDTGTTVSVTPARASDWEPSCVVHHVPVTLLMYMTCRCFHPRAPATRIAEVFWSSVRRLAGAQDGAVLERFMAPFAAAGAPTLWKVRNLSAHYLGRAVHNVESQTCIFWRRPSAAGAGADSGSVC